VATTVIFPITVLTTLAKAITRIATRFNVAVSSQVGKLVSITKTYQAVPRALLQKTIAMIRVFTVTFTVLYRRTISAIRLALVSSPLLLSRVTSRVWLVMVAPAARLAKTPIKILFSPVTIVASQTLRAGKILLATIRAVFRPGVLQHYPPIKFIVRATVWSLASFIRVRIVLTASVTALATLQTWFIERLRVIAKFTKDISDNIMANVQKRTESIREHSGVVPETVVGNFKKITKQITALFKPPSGGPSD
jgi:hypothetical protein